MKEEFKKRINKYVLRLIKFLGTLPKDIITREIIRQLMRSGTSIGANYFEAFYASSKKDYQNYFRHSLKSANESMFWLKLLQESDLVPASLKSGCSWLLKETNELSKPN